MTIKKATRESFGEKIVELGKKNDKIVVVSADLEDSTKAIYFREEFPERHFSAGIAEQDMICMAAGFSLEGFIPFANSFAVFMTNRAFDQIRMSVCYNKLNVKLVASHGGITVGPDGGSAQCLEDFSIMRVLPNMTVVCPADSIEALKATEAIAEYKGPVYMRTTRVAYDAFTSESDTFVLGKANVLREGKDATVIGCGLMLSEALSAADMLSKEGIEVSVINMHTIKPIDEDIIRKYAEQTGAVVTAEEHQITGGLGSAVSEVLGRTCPVPVEMVAVKDTFGESGTPEELMSKYGLKDVDIVEAIKRVLARKK
jgi:transketolase